jgi:hypothetical protein
MKVVKNDSLQCLTVYFSTEKGCKERSMQPGESLVVPESYITEQIKTLHRRRIFKISNA